MRSLVTSATSRRREGPCWRDEECLRAAGEPARARAQPLPRSPGAVDGALHVEGHPVQAGHHRLAQVWRLDAGIVTAGLTIGAHDFPGDTEGFPAGQ